MSTLLSSKSVGDTIKLNVNGTLTDFIIINQGLPSSSYDSSCNGTWVIMKDIYTTSTFGSSQLYASSTIHSYLTGTFYNLFDHDTKTAIKTVKIPYASAQTTVQTGSNGLETTCFLLSGTEVGLTNSYMNTEGAALSYFTSDSRRIAYLSGTATRWWLRSPSTSVTSYVWGVDTDGSGSGYNYSFSRGVRPALVLDSDFSVQDDGQLVFNTPPAITSSDTTDGGNLGTKNEPFSLSYTVTDEDADTMTVTEYLDSEAIATHSDVASGTSFNFANISDDAIYQKILNGTHTISIVADDGSDTTTFTTTFTKKLTTTTITLTNPLTIVGDISAATLSINGSIPSDAIISVKVTNNANDSSPVWQDATSEVLNGENIVFTNTTNTNGAAFNFIVTATRGSSDTEGYITSIVGAFQ